MIFYYLDASAWVKRYYHETGTRWVQALFSPTQKLACSPLGMIEVMATLARKRKAEEIAPSSFEQKVTELEDDWRRFIQVHLTGETVNVAKGMARAYALRGADAIHLASALMLQRRLEGEEDRLLLVASDQDLMQAAQSADLAVCDPTDEEIGSSQQEEEEEIPGEQ